MEEARKKSMSKVLIAIGLVIMVAILVLLAAAGESMAACISSQTYDAVNATKNATGVDLTPLVNDLLEECARIDNITANLNSNSTMLLTTNSTLASLMRNITHANATNFTVDNRTYYLITPDSAYNFTRIEVWHNNIDSTIASHDTRISAMAGSVSTLTNQMANAQSTLSSIGGNYANKSYVDSMASSISSSINQTVEDKIEEKGSTTYLWIGLGIVLLVSLGLFFLNQRGSVV